MTGNNPLDILKQAILLEARGKSFYEKVAEQSESEPVKAFFEMMADEEEGHIRMLSEQFKAYQSEKKFAPGMYDKGSGSVAAGVLTKDLKEKIGAAGFEAAAISAAMSMEERAIQLYSEREMSAEDPQEKALYKWLADWERQHLEVLVSIDRELTESVWHDNSFWPF